MKKAISCAITVSVALGLLTLIAPPSLAKEKKTEAQPAKAAPEKEAKKETAASAIDEKTEKVLRDLSAFYKSLKSVSMTMSSEMAVEAPGKQNQMTSTFSVIFERPNKIAMKLQSGKLGGTMVSDGTNLSLYSPIVNQYIKASAPPSLAAVFGTLDFQVISGGFSSLSLLEAVTDNDPYTQIVQDVTKAEYVGLEKTNETSLHHMKFTQKEISWDLWVDEGKEPWIRKVTADMSKILGGQQGQVPEELKNLKLDITVNYSDIKPNIQIAAGEFTFTPPTEAKEVKSFFQRRAAAAGGPHPLVDKPAPAFKVDTLAGSKFDIAEQKGKIVVLDFWASWCGPCTQALPILSEVTQSFKDKGVVFVAVNLGEKPDTIQTFLKSKNLNVEVALDPEGKVGELYLVRGIPQTVVVGKDGTVSKVHVGMSADLKTSFTEELNALVSGTAKTAAGEEKK